MEDANDIKFKVNEQYENEKGLFKVISIDRDYMVIRWENGEEIRTEVRLQQRIALRRQWEKANRLAKAQAAAKSSLKSASSRKKSEFSGFASTDFKKSVSRTTWRSRGQLGAAVIRSIETTRFKFNSWAFGRKPEMHIQDIQHRGRTEIDHQARFFVRVASRALQFGFHVACPDKTADIQTDWEAMIKWLTHEENEQIVNALGIKDNLTCRLINPSSGKLLAREYSWDTSKSVQPQSKKTFIAFIKDAPELKPFNFELSDSINKNEAVACGRDVGANIAQLFTRLVPLYNAAVTR